MGVEEYVPTNAYSNNKSLVINALMPKSMLNKRQSSTAYQSVMWSSA